MFYALSPSKDDDDDETVINTLGVHSQWQSENASLARAPNFQREHYTLSRPIGRSTEAN